MTWAEVDTSANRHPSSVVVVAATCIRNFASYLSFANLASSASAVVQACRVDACLAISLLLKAGLSPDTSSEDIVSWNINGIAGRGGPSRRNLRRIISRHFRRARQSV